MNCYENIKETPHHTQYSKKATIATKKQHKMNQIK